MTYVISDLHGIPMQQFQDLLEQAGFSEKDMLFVLGDTIDSGPDGVRLLLWMMEQHNVFHLLGNHEAMLLSIRDMIFTEVTEDALEQFFIDKMGVLSTMLVNGAQPTLNSLQSLMRKSPEQVEHLMEYIQDMPLYDGVEVNGTTYLLVHAGLGNFAADRKLSEYTTDDLLWHRPELDEEYLLGDDVMVVFGHTPTSYYGVPGKIVKTDTWCCIDTSDVGPTLVRLDDWAHFVGTARADSMT